MNEVLRTDWPHTFLLFQNVFTDLETLAAIFACAIHDVDHPGLTNSFLVNTSKWRQLNFSENTLLKKATKRVVWTPMT